MILGIGLEGKSIGNPERNRECVINLPSSLQWKQVEKIAPYTVVEHVPVYKQEMGYTYQKDKFTMAGCKPLDSQSVKPQCIKECPLQIEANVKQVRVPEYDPFFAIVETEVVHVHAHKEIIKGGNHIHPQKWSPLFYNFRHYFSIEEELGKNYRV